MERAAIDVIDAGVIGKGETRQSAVLTLDDEHDRATLTCIRAAWPDLEKEVVTVRAEQSVDDGETWILLCEFSARGKDETPIGFSPNPSVTVPVMEGKSRKFRVFCTAGETIATKVEFEGIKSGEVKQIGRPPMSVSFDAVSSVDFAGISTTSWTHTPSGTPSNAGACANTAVASGSSAVTSFTYGGVSMAQEVTAEETTTLPKRASIWELGTGIPSGAQTVTVVFTAGSHFGGCAAVTVVGGDPADTFSNSASLAWANPTAATVNCTSAVSELVLDCITVYDAGGSPTATVGASQTERWNRKNAGASTRTAGSTEPGAASVTMSWTYGGVGPSGCLVAASFKEASTGNRRRRLLLSA